MKKKYTLFFAVLALAVGGSSCSGDRGAEINGGGGDVISLHSSIDHLRVDSYDGLSYVWSPDDAIGVSSSGLAKKNIRYKAKGSGISTSFDAASKEDALRIPLGKSDDQDLTAYYPYGEADAEGNVKIDLVKNHPLLMAKGTVSKGKPSVALHFKHQLAMLRIVVDATQLGTHDTPKLVMVSDLATKATFGIVAGKIERHSTGTITLKQGANKSEFYTFILPEEVLEGKRVTISLGAKTYQAVLPSNAGVKAGKYYSYVVKPADKSGTSSVKDDGSKEHPYRVEHVVNNQGAGKDGKVSDLAFAHEGYDGEGYCER